MKDTTHLLNVQIDPPEYFSGTRHNYFFLTALKNFDTGSAQGGVFCKRFRRKFRFSFNQEMLPFEETQGWEFPPDYQNDRIINLAVDFLTDNTLRIRTPTKAAS
ncbi:MAG: hypothetical protein LBP76_06655 [Treponema sp.]|jgi:hypothetical protein|nr:hypothetical protein [Treponema sp.]